MLGDVLNTQELLTLATSIEGHPDNVAPALLGGLTSSVFEDGKVYSVKRNVDETLCFAAIVPDYKLLTEAARAALPKDGRSSRPRRSGGPVRRRGLHRTPARR